MNSTAALVCAASSTRPCSSALEVALDQLDVVLEVLELVGVTGQKPRELAHPAAIPLQRARLTKVHREHRALAHLQLGELPDIDRVEHLGTSLLRVI